MPTNHDCAVIFETEAGGLVEAAGSFIGKQVIGKAAGMRLYKAIDSLDCVIRVIFSDVNKVANGRKSKAASNIST